jgi:hypothetical protein
MSQITRFEPSVDDDAPAVRAQACGHCGGPV